MHSVSVHRTVQYDTPEDVPCDPMPYNPYWISVSGATDTYLVLDVARGIIVLRAKTEQSFPVVQESNDPPSSPFLVTLTPGTHALAVSDPACAPIPYETKK